MSMKQKILEQAKYIIKLTEFVKSGMLDIKNIPTADILLIAKGVYNMVGYCGDMDAELYAELLAKGLKNDDKEQVSDVLLLMANQFIVLAVDYEQMEHLENKLCTTQSRLAHSQNIEKILNFSRGYESSKEELFVGKGVIYSAITGGYDDIKEPEHVIPGMDYILFTDNPEVKSDVWKIRLITNPEGLDNVRLARRIKIMGHEYLQGYDYSIWVDGKLTITDDLQEFISQYRRQQPILCFPHYANDCIYQEAQDCKKLQKDDEDIIDNQILRYSKENYPEHNGLIESGLMVRQLHDERVKKVMEEWWRQVVSYSRRDQLSFNYACWKNNFLYDTAELYLYGNKYVRRHMHVPEMNV